MQQAESTGPCLAVVIVIITTHFSQLSAETMISISMVGTFLCTFLLIAMIANEKRRPFRNHKWPSLPMEKSHN
ncbi:hypothetical protein PQ460_11115 [Paenibacillus sp. KACC 21273]|uniref:hypothetical protein n=1 Tax=Paenibacillus sp. KACC 21273 TaxID=3025665 RepID=UPI0023652FCC|nr:hypothetical protein [Paenibacillus sp. KACC 21273]WDF52934.1 hypothetical protein PQ460_11115 [Paenibacillus sp. KACC 21273]